MTTEEYLKSFLPAEVYKDYQANRPAYHPESMFNSDEDRMFCGLTMAIEDEAERIGIEVFEANGHTAADAREFYDQGALDDVAAWIAAEIVCRRAYDCWEDAEEELNYELERRCGNAFLAQLGEHEEEDR